MKKIVSFALLVLLLLTAPLATWAAPPPEAVEKAKQEAPLQVIGEVTHDRLVKDLSGERGYLSETRAMTLRIQQIVKHPADLNLRAGDSFDVHYTFIPRSVDMSGPARVEVMVGDVLEIWLMPRTDEAGEGKGEWMPAMSGNTITFHKQIPRRDLPEPPLHVRFLDWMRDMWVLVFAIGAVATALFIQHKRTPKA